MSDERTLYVFDSGPLSHFAQAGWLGLLREFVGAVPAWIPQAVSQEAVDGVDNHPHLRGVLEAQWLQKRGLQTAVEQVKFGRYTSRLVGADMRKNLGECEVLALAEANGGTAVIDDGVARTLAREFHVDVLTSLGLLCELVRDRHLGLDMACGVADSLLETEYRLPIDPGGFRQFVMENDYLPEAY